MDTDVYVGVTQDAPLTPSASDKGLYSAGRYPLDLSALAESLKSTLKKLKSHEPYWESLYGHATDDDATDEEANL